METPFQCRPAFPLPLTRFPAAQASKRQGEPRAPGRGSRGGGSARARSERGPARPARRDSQYLLQFPGERLTGFRIRSRSAAGEPPTPAFGVRFPGSEADGGEHPGWVRPNLPRRSQAVLGTQRRCLGLAGRSGGVITVTKKTVARPRLLPPARTREVAGSRGRSPLSGAASAAPSPGA